MNPDKYYTDCSLCPRSCHVNRADGKLGRCGVSSSIFAARAALHFWEEPCISGENGSGAVFFSGCSMRCVFCQNHEISRGQSGKTISMEELADIFLRLKEKEAENINLVTPDHYMPSIACALDRAADRGLDIPVIANTGGYTSDMVLDMMKDRIDVYLPDLKYMDPNISKRYSDAVDYFDIASGAIRKMHEFQPELIFDERNMIKKGVIVRHMILPGHTKDSMRILDHLYNEYGDSIFISIMNQYTPPVGISDRFAELGRKITKREYERVIDYAIGIGIKNAFIQDYGTAKESFIPPFDNEGLDRP